MFAVTQKLPMRFERAQAEGEDGSVGEPGTPDQQNDQGVEAVVSGEPVYIEESQAETEAVAEEKTVEEPEATEEPEVVEEPEATETPVPTETPIPVEEQQRELPAILMQIEDEGFAYVKTAGDGVKLYADAWMERRIGTLDGGQSVLLALDYEEIEENRFAAYAKMKNGFTFCTCSVNQYYCNHTHAQYTFYIIDTKEH